MTTPPPTGTWLVVTLGPLGLLEAALSVLGLGLVDEAVLLGSDPDAVGAADDWDAAPADVSLEQAASAAAAPATVARPATRSTARRSGPVRSPAPRFILGPSADGLLLGERFHPRRMCRR